MESPSGGRLLAVLALGLAACSGPERPGTPPRNAVLITVSALRADHVSAWLYPRPTTSSPGLDPPRRRFSVDALADQGVMFARAFAPSAASAPSLASLHTGRLDFAAGAATLAEAFRDAGFRTAAFTSGAAVGDGVLARGFERFEGFGADLPDPDYAAVVAATTWLREEALEGDAPFLLWLHLSGPRAPYAPLPLGKDTFADRFADPDYTGAADGSLDYLAALRDPAAGASGLDLGRVVALYDAELARVDHMVRAFAQTLAGSFDILPRDVLAESVIVFAGDSGAELYQHGRAFEDDTSLHDAALHVPVFLRHPASLTGRRILAPVVELRDLAPTLLDWFGIEVALGMDGRSLLALTDSHVERPFEMRPARAGTGDARTVRTVRWRLIRRGGAVQLFDLERDPLERVDVAGEHPDLVAELEAKLGAG